MRFITATNAADLFAAFKARAPALRLLGLHVEGGQARVDLCVLEVGLGGRFDATNAVDSDVAVVTGVALDHTEHLGDTLEIRPRILWERDRIRNPVDLARNLLDREPVYRLPIGWKSREPFLKCERPFHVPVSLG